MISPGGPKSGVFTEKKAAAMIHLHIRKAEPEDLDGILAIYNEEVLNGIATFALEPMSQKDGLIWLAEHDGGNRCVYVGLAEDGGVVGYVSLSRFRPKGGYDRTAELSVYVAKPYRGQGAASQLMEFILRQAKADPTLRALVSIITSSNTPSRNLHEKYGFRHAGTLREVGWKFGIALDADYYELLV